VAHISFDLGETMNPNRRFFVLGYSGFRGFPALKIQAWETLKRSRPLSLAKISQKNLSFDTEVFLRVCYPAPTMARIQRRSF
jgi:hypothetical protein